MSGKCSLLCGEVDVLLTYVSTVLAFQPLHHHPLHHRHATDGHGVDVADHNARLNVILALAVCTIILVFLRFDMQNNRYRTVFGMGVYLLPDSVLMV